MRYRANLIGTILFCCLAVLAMAWGWFDAGGLRADSPGHATAVISGAIGLLLGLPVLGSALALDARARATRAAPQGGWSVSPAHVAELIESQHRTGAGNEWRPTRAERAHGFEVCWADEHLVVGAYYWRVAPGARLSGVRVSLGPPTIAELHYVQTWAHNMSSLPRFIRTEREFRFPAPDEAHARAFVSHVTRLLAGESTLDRRRRLVRLSNWAFAAAACFLGLLLIGFGVAWHDQTNGIFRPTAERAALIAATTLGIMGTPTLLFIGWIVRMNVRR